jgi:hypothetical protein
MAVMPVKPNRHGCRLTRRHDGSRMASAEVMFVRNDNKLAGLHRFQPKRAARYRSNTATMSADGVDSGPKSMPVSHDGGHRNDMAHMTVMSAVVPQKNGGTSHDDQFASVDHLST